MVGNREDDSHSWRSVEAIDRSFRPNALIKSCCMSASDLPQGNALSAATANAGGDDDHDVDDEDDAAHQPIRPWNRVKCI